MNSKNQNFKLSFLIFSMFSILMIAFLSVSCSVQSQDKNTERVANDVSDTVIKEESEFERNRKLWQGSRISNYKMTLKMSQTGLYSPESPVEVTVEDSKAVLIKNLEDKKITVESYKRFGNNTIEEMFEKIQSAENQKADRLEVRYDSKLGYPKEISIDKKLLTNDDESYVKVENFQVIK